METRRALACLERLRLSTNAGAAVQRARAAARTAAAKESRYRAQVTRWTRQLAKACPEERARPARLLAAARSRHTPYVQAEATAQVRLQAAAQRAAEAERAWRRAPELTDIWQEPVPARVVEQELLAGLGDDPVALAAAADVILVNTSYVLYPVTVVADAR